MKPIFELPAGESKKRRTCMLMVTHACNLCCTYCYEQHKDSGMMSLATAKGIITRELEVVRDSDCFDELEIDFMGGEPLMNFSLIKDVVEWLEQQDTTVPYICFAATNGTLVDGAMKSWLKKHREKLVLGVSVDGTESMQEANRGVVGGKIDLDFFASTWPAQPFHMTISRSSLPTLAKGVMALQGKGYCLNAALAQGEDWTADDSVVYMRELESLAKEYLENPDITPINLLSPVLVIDGDTESVQRKFCGAGTYMCTYDIDGKRYGCHMFSPIVLGDRALEKDNVIWGKEDICQDEYCARCVLKQICPTCAGFNFRYRGGIANRDKRICRMALTQFKVASVFQLKRLSLENAPLQPSDARHAHYAVSAHQVLERLSTSASVGPYRI